MAQMVLLRHGESQWNLENRFTGWVDVPLSRKGEQEARVAGQKLIVFRFDAAYTSVLKRAIDTLNLVLMVIGQTDIAIEKVQAINERQYGHHQAMKTAETISKY